MAGLPTSDESGAGNGGCDRASTILRTDGSRSESGFRPKDPVLDSSLAWGCSSAGRAPRSHRGGQGFESPHLHHSLRYANLGRRHPRRAACPEAIPPNTAVLYVRL